MSQLFAIARRDLAAYFVSPVAYIVMAVYLLLCGYFFMIIVWSFAEAQAFRVSYQVEMRFLISNMAVVLLFVSPMMTMRAFAEEKKTGTMELLLTSPVSATAMVTGKYLAVAIFFFAMVAVTFQYPLFLMSFGNPDIGSMIAAYAGFVLMGLSFLAVGMFTSSLTENQIVATVLSFGILLFLYVIGWAGSQIGGLGGEVCKALSITAHFEGFTKGLIDLTDVAYYLSVIVIFLFVTIRRFEWNRW